MTCGSVTEVGKRVLTNGSVAEVCASAAGNSVDSVAVADTRGLEAASDEEDEMLLVGLAMPESELLPLAVAEVFEACRERIWSLLLI